MSIYDANKVLSYIKFKNDSNYNGIYTSRIFNSIWMVLTFLGSHMIVQIVQCLNSHFWGHIFLDILYSCLSWIYSVMSQLISLLPLYYNGHQLYLYLSFQLGYVIGNHIVNMATSSTMVKTNTKSIINLIYVVKAEMSHGQYT